MTILAIGATRADAQKPPSVAEQPAATLLLPYFEVDLANPAGANTFFAINNASATAILAHVTIWSEYSVPVLAFNVYLTGFDMQTIDLRAVLTGTAPRTATAGQDPGDQISHKGTFSQDINFASCGGQFPLPPVPTALVEHVESALTGQQSALFGTCASKPDGTRVARGYVTVDTVNNCTLRFPTDPGYFINGGAGDATNQNVLWGDYAHTDHIAGQESSDGSPLVHIRADALDPDTSVPGQYTFYARLVAATAADNREPLSTTFGARYYNGTATWTSTTLTVWRDIKVSQNAFGCATTPTWYPLSQEQITFFDDQEQAQTTEFVPYAPQLPNQTPLPFPKAAQRATVGGASLPTVFQSGWVYLNLNTSVPGGVPVVDPAAAQAWVSVHHRGVGRYSVGFPAVAFDSAREALHTIIPVF